MRASFLASKQSSISKMLHDNNLFLSPHSIFWASPMFNFVEGRQINEQPLMTTTMITWVGTPIVTTITTIVVTITKLVPEKKRKIIIKEVPNKTMKTKNDIIEVGESGEDDEEESARFKWRNFDLHHLIAIWGEMDKFFAKIANKQGKFIYINYFSK